MTKITKKCVKSPYLEPLRSSLWNSRTSRNSNIVWSSILYRGMLMSGIGAIILILVAVAAFSFLSLPSNFSIDPIPDSFRLRGSLWQPKLGDNFLLLPGKYRVEAEKVGYEPLSETIEIQRGKITKFRFNLTPRPGVLGISAINIKSRKPLTGVKVSIDGYDIGETPIARYELAAGSYQVHAEVARYLPLNTRVDIIGKDEEQKLILEMLPGWSAVSIPEGPKDAKVFVDGKEMGMLPLDFQHDAGTCLIAVLKDNFEPWSTEIELKPGEKKVLPAVKLEPARGQLKIQTQPAGAVILVNTNFIGLSPTDIKMDPDESCEIKVLKPGFKPMIKNISLKSGETKSALIELLPSFGTVELEVDPANAEILIDGTEYKINGPLSLPAKKHSIVVRKDGYQEVRRVFTPIAGHPLRLKIKLKNDESIIAELPKEVTILTDYTMKLIVPEDSFFLGSTRREPNRRSNETMRKVELKRPFMIGVQEVSNSQFKQFDYGHNSGESLDSDDQPAVNITWGKAALFCNWLSEKEGLPPAYVEDNGHVMASSVINTGYRLPSEAEWAYCLRSASGKEGMYPWGKKWPPTEALANIADKSAHNFDFPILENYNDGFPRTAAVGAFKADRNGLYDLVGNVAEWCHDYYGIYNYNPNSVEVEPLGPEYGVHHVIRGSSWRHGTRTQLRLAFRDYSNDKRDDTGFRICRYITPSIPSESN